MFLFRPAGELSEKVHPVGQSRPMGACIMGWPLDLL